MALAVVAAFGLALLPAIAQDPNYHRFADQREFWRVPHFWNVLSNLPFVLVGLYGIWAWAGSVWLRPAHRWAWLVVAIGTIAVGLGSGYYHWRPTNVTLFWDRLPMTVVFMGLLSAALAEMVDSHWGTRLLLPLLLIGLASVAYWIWGELQGQGDLRLYAVVQFYPMLALPICLLWHRSLYTHAHYLRYLVGGYVLAKLAEHFDRQLFAATEFLLSGHTLKHLVAAVAMATAMRMLAVRRPLPQGEAALAESVASDTRR